MDNLLDYYHVPRNCVKCGGVMVFVGVGEYHCEDCGEVAYDDYGKVRLYIEGHVGATVSEVEEATGVPRRTIRRMLKEGRIEVAEGSKTFLLCEVCGKAIRSGRYCPECEAKVHRSMEEKQRAQLAKDLKGYSLGQSGEEGQRRFVRER